jgi:hypothetical protein
MPTRILEEIQVEIDNFPTLIQIQQAYTKEEGLKIGQQIMLFFLIENIKQYLAQKIQKDTPESIANLFQ